MEQQDFAAALAAIGYPVAYRAFKSAQDPPFLCWFFASGDDFMADNTNYLPIGNYVIEHYTNEKDPASEELVEEQLAACGLPFRKSETYIDTEKMHLVLYEIQLI